MGFSNESEFESALISLLSGQCGWDKEILHRKTERELVQNWANILFENNRGIDRLNDHPLTDGEMEQILEQITKLRTPLMLNGFINGKTVQIKRDNPLDSLHFGKEVSLSIYDRNEIAAGQSRYQIATQPVFSARCDMLNDRRGDILLLINGMPVIHIELKKSGIPISQACNQIEKYSYEGIFSGLFSLVQIFVAMTPEETLYFANPGPDGKFNKDYYFHWADFDNEPINNWQGIALHLLSIPRAHELIGFYTVADETDGILKVMRSYQFYAARAISDKVAKTKWAQKDIYGGYIWHTTGSGKTLTSFKSAQLIASSSDADKVIFLVDRIELGTQSLREYRGFADDSESVQATENTKILITKLKSSDPLDTLIVTSIQKMSNIKEEGAINSNDIQVMNEKRIVFIVDECHRSTFGEMLSTIKNTFSSAIFFGFTGTPIHNENQRNMSTTASVFGDELHRYSIADGIRDKNVLGFDPYKVSTYKDRDLRQAVALLESKAGSVQEAQDDDIKSQIYYKFMNNRKIPMAGFTDETGKRIKGIEDYISSAQYNGDTHRKQVVSDILDNWQTLSRGSKFHAIFATSSIPQAIEYYTLFKNENSGLRVTALFDQNIDNKDGAIVKEAAAIEILNDYNKMFGQSYTLRTYQKFKRDVSQRLAHKRPYLNIEQHKAQQLDLLIVVDQMLTGFDSKWVNTLYLDKILRYESIIQAFSRTNRLFGPEKPFGTIKYYRKPHTMEKNIEEAVKLYSGDKPLGLFVNKLQDNLSKVNDIFGEISDLFLVSSITNFEKLPKEKEERAKFAQLFNSLTAYLEAARVQGFVWTKLEYQHTTEKGEKGKITVLLDEITYNTLLQRYKELARTSEIDSTDAAFDINGYITEINTQAIDSDYMNSRFEKYRKLLETDAPIQQIKQMLNELHKTFATLSQEDQRYANIFLRDFERGDINFQQSKTLKDYITEYKTSARDDKIRKFSKGIGINEDMLKQLMALGVTDRNINEFGRLDTLIKTVDRVAAKAYFEEQEKEKILPHKLSIKIDTLVREFVLSSGEDI